MCSNIVLVFGVPWTFYKQILIWKWADFSSWAWNKAIASFPGCSSISSPCFCKDLGIPPQESYHGNGKCNWLVISFYCPMECLSRVFSEGDQRWNKSMCLFIKSVQRNSYPSGNDNRDWPPSFFGKMSCCPTYITALARCCECLTPIDLACSLRNSKMPHFVQFWQSVHSLL